MRRKTVAQSLLLMAALILAAAHLATAQESPMLPSGARIETIFQPGVGTPVGEIVQFEGSAYVMHAKDQVAYTVAAGQRLYQNDTLICEKGGRVRFRLADDSTITVAPRTRLTIDRSIYDPDNKTRSVYMRLNKGKARFLIKKLVDFRQSSVKVKTRTAIAGVRGSRYITEAFIDKTVITAYEKTILDIICLANLEKEPITLAAFQQITIPEGQCPEETDIRKDLPRDLLNQLDRIFEFSERDPQASAIPPGRDYSAEPVVLPVDLLVPPHRPDIADDPVNNRAETVQRAYQEDEVRRRAGDDPLPPFPDPPQ